MVRWLFVNCRLNFHPMNNSVYLKINRFYFVIMFNLMGNCNSTLKICSVIWNNKSDTMLNDRNKTMRFIFVNIEILIDRFETNLKDTIFHQMFKICRSLLHPYPMMIKFFLLLIWLVRVEAIENHLLINNNTINNWN